MNQDSKGRLWLVAVLAAACLPFVAGFSTTRIFYIRDLTMFFWPRHLWIHDLVTHGHVPLWDPHSSGGQPVYTDALNQLFLAPVAALRYLPAIVGFNLMVLLPFPIAALGMWLFARRECSPVAAAAGAIAFAVSGPVVSTANFPNLSWSIAWVPWVFWAYARDRDDPSVANLVVLAGSIALQILSGEPVTMAGTLVVLIGYAVFASDGALRAAGGRLSRIALAIAGAVSASAVQLAPMLLAARTSARGLGRVDNFWSLHPLWLAESVLPHLFGNTFTAYDRQLPWMRTLNADRDPFFYSLYVGSAALVAVAVGLSSVSVRRRRFWAALMAVAVCFALGGYSPIYPFLQRILPPLRTFRFPVKFFLFVSFAIAMLTAHGIDALAADEARGLAPAIRRALRLASAAPVALIAVALASMVAPFATAHAFYALGAAVGIADPVAGAQFLFEHLRPVALRAALVWGAAIGLGFLVVRARGALRAGVVIALAALVAADLAVANAGVNPVIDATRLGRPAWAATVSRDPHARFYFGGKFRGSLVATDPDLRGVVTRAPRGTTVEEARTLTMAQLAMTPSPWGIRELISYDLPQLWPVEYLEAQTLFELADAPSRLRFLARGGVRYCISSHPMGAGTVPVAAASDELSGLAVYDCVPTAARLRVVERARVIENRNLQLAALFEESPDLASTILIDAPPPAPAGPAGQPAALDARFLVDGDTEVAAEVSAGAGGAYLLLLDSYDPGWTATVDGEPARVIHANALYRAVRVNAGRHRVRFVYRPVVFYVFAALSLLTWVLGLSVLLARLTPRRA